VSTIGTIIIMCILETPPPGLLVICTWSRLMPQQHSEARHGKLFWSSHGYVYTLC